MNENAVDNYNKERKKQFDEWKKVKRTEFKIKGKTDPIVIDHGNDVFIKDGVMCPCEWFKEGNHIRPLFLLKEAYGGGADWNLSDHVLQEGVRCTNDKTWKRVSGWVKGLLNTTADGIAPYIRNDEEISFYGNDYLKRIAVINVKKRSGTSNSDSKEIHAYAEFDAYRLFKQLELCDPTIIICGYTGTELDIIMTAGTGEKTKKSPNDNLFYHITLNGHDVLVLDYWHPANRYPDIMNYYGLMAIYQQAFKSCQE